MRALFKQLAKIPFDVVGTVTLDAVYTITNDNGFDPTTTEDYPCKLIVDGNAKKVFGDLAETTDNVGYVYSNSCDVEITRGKITAGKTYSIEENNIDPAGACYVLLLRDTHA